jgi:hypothetical protein
MQPLYGKLVRDMRPDISPPQPAGLRNCSGAAFSPLKKLSLTRIFSITPLA